jgi:hypothetical protein
VKHGIPTTVELVQAVRQFVADEIGPGSPGRLRFLARVANNVLRHIEADLKFGAEIERSKLTRLSRLGLADEAELCAAIRSGALDSRRDEVVEIVRAGLVDRLRVTNHSYLRPQDVQSEPKDGSARR